MSLHGTIDTMSVDELVGWIRTRQHSGILKFKRGQRIKTLNVEAGRVANAASNDAREYFGQFLINFGLISEDQLQKAFETQQETRVLLGRILVMTGLLTEEQVLQMLELKIRETVLDIYLWPDGAFEFHDGLLSDDPSVVPVAVDLEQLNAEGLRRRAQHAEIRRLIPDNRCTFTALPSQQAKPDPGSSTSVILDLASQGYSAADIILRFHSVDFPILHSLCDLVSRGYLQVVPAAEDRPPSMPVIEVELDDVVEQEQPAGPDDILLEAERAMRERDLKKAVAILKKGLVEHPYDPELSDALETAESGLLDQLRSELLATDRIPVLVDPDTALLQHDWSPAQRYLLSRIDGRRHLRSIIMVSPLKEVEALLTFQQLENAGVVFLR